MKTDFWFAIGLAIFWFAIGFASNGVINLIFAGYFDSHDELDANNTITKMPLRSGDDDFSIVYDTDLGWIVRDDTVHSKAYGSYPAEVPFEQGMTIYPGQSATMTVIMNDVLSDSTVAELYLAWLLTETDTTK